MSTTPSDYAPALIKRKSGPNWLLRTGVTAVIIVGGIAVLLPSLCQPRETANRAKCASNLHQIGLAISLYAGEHGGQYPDSFATIMTSEQLSPAVFVCPSSNDEAAEGDSPTAVAANLTKPHHLSYVYLGNGLSTATVKKDMVIVYELPENHQGDGMNLLFGDGHAEWVQMARAKQLIAKATTQPIATAK